MKGRYCKVFLFAAIAIMIAAISGYPIDAKKPHESDVKRKSSVKNKSAVKHKPSKRTTQKTLAANSSNTYVARQGDCLLTIAHAFKTTPAALKSANNLRNNKIKAGQILKIPILENNAKNHAVKTSETPADQVVESMGPLVPGTGEDTSDAGDFNLPPIRLQLVEAGFEMLGVRYRRSGISAESGFDCSGLVKSLFSKFNIDLPRSSREQYKVGEKIDRDKLEVGDLLFFSSGGKLPTHVGIYVGDNKFLHAARKAHQVIVSDLNKFWYAMRYLGARRIETLWGGDATSPVGDQPENK